MSPKPKRRQRTRSRPPDITEAADRCRRYTSIAVALGKLSHESADDITQDAIAKLITRDKPSPRSAVADAIRDHYRRRRIELDAREYYHSLKQSGNALIPTVYRRDHEQAQAALFDRDRAQQLKIREAIRTLSRLNCASRYTYSVSSITTKDS